MQLILLSLLFGGVLTGHFTRRFVARWNGRVVTVLIWALLFLLGVSTGSDPAVVNGMGTLGLNGAVISVAGVLGSCFGAALLWRIVHRKRDGVRLEKEDDRVGNKSGNRLKQFLHRSLGSWIIIAFFAVGVICGLSGKMTINAAGMDLSLVTLLVLIFFVGMGIGCDLGSFRELRSESPVLLLLPFVTIVGTLAGCALVTLITPTGLTDNLAIGSGFGYYSLSSVFITQFRGAALGTTALIANIVRELITLMGAPLLCRLFGPLAPISAGGATSMDTTLPTITAATGSRFAVISIYSGFVTDFSVPLLVPLFAAWQ